MKCRKPLRVCHVTYSFYETDNRVMRYAETLAARGDEVDVLSLRRPGQGSRGFANGVRILRLQRRLINEKRPWTYLLKIAWFFAKCFAVLTTRGLTKGYDVVHVHNIPDFLVFAAAVPKLQGSRIILDIHDIVPELYAGKFGESEESLIFRSLRLVERASCRLADHVIVANHLWKAKLTRRSVPAAKCTALLNYPDLQVFKATSGSRQKHNGRFVFLYPGTLNHHQGLDIAVDAFNRASSEMPNAEFRIYGDGPARPDLEQQVRRLGVGDRVKILDPVPLHDVPSIIRSSHAGIVPKRADGFGNEAFSTKILEFMACGVPVIVSKTTVDAYYFTDDLVRFVKPSDPGALATAMVDAYAGRIVPTAAATEFVGNSSWQKHVAEYLLVVDGADDNEPHAGKRQVLAARLLEVEDSVTRMEGNHIRHR